MSHTAWLSSLSLRRVRPFASSQMRNTFSPASARFTAMLYRIARAIASNLFATGSNALLSRMAKQVDGSSLPALISSCERSTSRSW